MASEGIPVVTDPGGHLPPLGIFDSSVKLEEVATDNPSYDGKSLVPEGASSVVEPEESVTHLVPAGMYSSVVGSNCQLVPYETTWAINANFRPTVDVAQPSLYENLYRSLLVANQELMILVGELRRERNATERRCNELNRMLEGRDRDNVLYRAEIDRLAGLGRALRGQIDALDSENARLRRRRGGGYH
ncbi:hypothetical protein Tco_0561212 [Tanacetum coccineum]